jgi:two-component system sensor histidine kinase UhpB
MIDDGSAVNGAFDGPPQKALQSVEALQSTSRRILDHLRPLYIEDLGLQASIEKLLRNVRSQVPSIELAFEIDPALKSLDAVVSQTVFRVLQEAITNVLRHAQASQLYLGAIVKGGKVYVEVSDNGLGMAADVSFGRGLTGMRERVRALGGTFEMSRNEGRTYVRCSLPTEPAAS